jgi:hypothetical protein
MITFGIYALVWYVKTKDEMNAAGAEIPTAWLLIVPIANIYWIWKFCEGVGKITRDDLSPIVALLLLMFLGPIGMAVIQSSFNKKALPVGNTAAAY